MYNIPTNGCIVVKYPKVGITFYLKGWWYVTYPKVSCTIHHKLCMYGNISYGWVYNILLSWCNVTGLVRCTFYY